MFKEESQRVKVRVLVKELWEIWCKDGAMSQGSLIASLTSSGLICESMENDKSWLSRRVKWSKFYRSCICERICQTITG